jgi:hypothetical protein
MAKKLICDVCGQEITVDINKGYTYDMIIKKRNSGIYGQANLDVCRACLNKMDLTKFIKEVS